MLTLVYSSSMKLREAKDAINIVESSKGLIRWLQSRWRFWLIANYKQSYYIFPSTTLVNCVTA